MKCQPTPFVKFFFVECHIKRFKKRKERHSDLRGGKFGGGKWSFRFGNARAVKWLAYFSVQTWSFENENKLIIKKIAFVRNNY